MFSSYISREIGSALALYQQEQLGYFRYYYEEKIKDQFNRLTMAKDNFLQSVYSNERYLSILNNYIGSQVDADATSIFYAQRDKILTELINDKQNRVANKLWKEMNKTEELVFDIRNSIYGGRAETKYHIGIQVQDENNKLLKSYELDPSQMLRLQNNRGIFQAEITTSKGIDKFDFSLRFSTKKGLTAESLIKAITSEGGKGINGQEYAAPMLMSDFSNNYYFPIQSRLKDLKDISNIEENIGKVKDQIEVIKKQRTGIGYKTEYNKQKREEINKQLQVERTRLKELLKSQERAINFGYGRGFEALERQRNNLEFMPTQDNGLTYDDNTSWVMQQDVNFINKTNEAKLMMIQNKFFAEHSRFSTISMSSLFESLRSLEEYFTMSDQEYQQFKQLSFDEQNSRRLDQDVYNFLQDEIVNSLQPDDNDDSGWDWED